MQQKSRELLRQTVFSLQILGAGGALLLAGCGKKETPPPAALPSAPAEPADGNKKTPVLPVAPRPSATLPVAPVIPASAGAEESAAQLSVALHRYVIQTRTIPKTFEDFVAHYPVKFPPPPAGKKYVIEEGKVVVQ